MKIFPEIAKEVPDAWLIIAGKTRLQEYTDYRDYFYKLVEASPVSDRILVLRGQFPQNTFDVIISASDVVPMPYQKGAQSGIMAHCLALGKPIVASPLRSFVDTIEKSGAGLIAEKDEEFAAAIVKILRDKQFAKDLSENAIHFVRDHISWAIVAEETIKVYQRIVVTPYGKARYVEF